MRSTDSCWENRLNNYAANCPGRTSLHGKQQDLLTRKRRASRWSASLGIVTRQAKKPMLSMPTAWRSKSWTDASGNWPKKNSVDVSVAPQIKHCESQPIVSHDDRSVVKLGINRGVSFQLANEPQPPAGAKADRKLEAYTTLVPLLLTIVL